MKKTPNWDLVRRIVAETGELDEDEVAKVLDSSDKNQFLFHGISSTELYRSAQQKGIMPKPGRTPIWYLGSRAFGKISVTSTPKQDEGCLFLSGEEERPMTPEEETKEGELFGYDSVFYNGAHAHDQDKNGKSYGTLAITRIGDIQPQGVLVNLTEEEIPIVQQVPRRLIHIVRVEVDHSDARKESREIGKIVERTLFKHIYDVVVNNNYLPGDTNLDQIKLER